MILLRQRLHRPRLPVQVAATLGIVGLAAYLLLAAKVLGELSGPAFGSMVAIFVAAKFNPVPLEALVLAGIICAGGNIRIRRMVGIPLALAIAAIVTPVAVADHIATKSVHHATKVNPYELEYKVHFLNAAIIAMQITDSQELHDYLADEIREEARVAIDKRPRNEIAWKIFDASVKVDR